VSAEQLAQISNNLVYSAIAVYAMAMFAFAGEWAFGTRSRVGRSAALVGVGGGPVGTAAVLAPPLDLEQEKAEKSVRLGRIALALTILAFLLHFGGVLARGFSAGRVPWGNMYEFSTASALAVTGAFLVLMRRYDLRWLGIFVVVPVLLTLGLAVTVLYTDSGELVPALKSYWLVIHVVAAVIASGIFTVGAALSVLYLVRDRISGPSRVPSAETLDRLAYRVHAFSFPIWTFAVIAGAIWAENAWGRYWGWDPKETWAFITWVVYAAYLHARATAGWKGGRAAAVALAGYGCFLFNYFFVNMVVSGLHSYAGI
jgi:cytochrome c-type biogenesis protein CcsB